MKRLSFLALALAVAVGAQTYSASGTITHNEKTVTIQSASAVWDGEERQLTIGLFPFELSRKDVAELKKSAPLFLAVDKPSPDPQVWPSPPFAELVIELHPGAHALEPEAVKHYVLHASWIDRKNYTVSPNRNSLAEVQREFSRLSGSLGDGGSLQFAFRGSQKFDMGGDLLEWSVEVNTTVHLKQ